MKNTNVYYDFRQERMLNVKVTTFPDGQKLVTVLNEDFDTNKDHTIVIRINTFDDFSLLIQTVSFLNDKGIKPHVHIPYMFGARADRKFDNGQVNFMRDVVGKVLNSLDVKNIYSIDPHSYVTEAVINKYKENKPALQIFYDSLANDFVDKKVTLLFPDAGAQKKAKFVEEIIDYYTAHQSLYARKARNEATGEITEVVIDGLKPDLANREIIIFDDICDGGWTFIQLAKEVRRMINLYIDNGVNMDKFKLHLVVTHGIFSKGVSTVMEHFDSIYTTNSIFQKEEGISNFNVYKY